MCKDPPVIESGFSGDGLLHINLDAQTTDKNNVKDIVKYVFINNKIS